MLIGRVIEIIYASGIFCYDAKDRHKAKGENRSIYKRQPAIFCCEKSDNQEIFMPKYKEVDYKGPKSRWPLWVIPFLVAILLVLIGIFIFVTLGAKQHRCLFFDCEQPRDKVAKTNELRNDAVIPPKDEKSGSETKANKVQEESQMKNSAMTVHGELIFAGGAPESLPPNSHLKVKFEDTSLMDASSVLLGETMVDLSSYNKATNLKYVIKCKKPNAHEHYSVSAVLNMGWKADENSWIRKGDYHTDTHFSVKMEDGVSDYKKDITLVQYN